MESEMNWKRLFTELCEDLEFKLTNFPLTPDSPKIKVPVTLRSFNTPAFNGGVFELRLEIDNLCTFRETVYWQIPQTKKQAENSAYMRLLKATFCYGVEAARKIIDERLKTHGE